jgi:hypothetical protein
MFMVMAAIELLFPAQVNHKEDYAPDDRGCQEQDQDRDDEHFPCAERTDGQSGIK